jgi:hypothetical protein
LTGLAEAALGSREGHSFGTPSGEPVPWFLDSVLFYFGFKSLRDSEMSSLPDQWVARTDRITRLPL